eukprot:1127458-Pelagomonas_calceolata.AAC.1
MKACALVHTHACTHALAYTHTCLARPLSLSPSTRVRSTSRCDGRDLGRGISGLQCNSSPSPSVSIPRAPAS